MRLPAGAGPWWSRPILALVAFACVLAVAACRPEPSPPPGSRRIVILGVDGAGWDQLSPLMKQGRLPNLARLYRSGAAGRLEPAGPLSPASLYTSIATGRPPAVHGILGETIRTPDGYGLKPVTADRRRSPPVWKIVSSRGLAVGVTAWPATFPVDRIDGFMMADMFQPGLAGTAGFIQPPEAFGGGEDPAARVALPESVEPVAALDPGLRRRFEADVRALERGLFLYRVYRPRLAFFRLESLDYACHRFWQYYQTGYLDLARSRGQEVDPDRAAAMARAVPGAYLFLDAYIGLLMDGIPIDATLLIVSPYSFRGVGLTDYLHVDLDGLLERLGYLARESSGEIDWSSTRAFASGGATGPARGIYINRSGREAKGIVQPERAETLVKEVAAALSSLRTEAGEPLFRTVDPSPSPAGDAPDIRLLENLELDPMSPVHLGQGVSAARDLFRRYSEDFSIHQPEGVLLAAGQGIVAGATGLEANLYEIAPTILRLLGLPPAAKMAGTAVGGLLDDAVPAVGTGPDEYADVPASPEPVFLPEAVSKQWLEKLNETGHIPSHSRRGW